MTTEREVKEALGVLLKHKNKKCLRYATAYAERGLTLTGDALEIQMLYVVSNMVYWRGPEAKRVRKVLSSFWS